MLGGECDRSLAVASSKRTSGRSDPPSGSRATREWRRSISPRRARRQIYVPMAECAACRAAPHVTVNSTTVRAIEDQHPAMPRRNLLEQLSHFPAIECSNRDEPGDIAARPRQARDEPARNRVGDTDEDDRNRRAVAAARALVVSVPLADNHVRRQRTRSAACARMRAISPAPNGIDPQISTLDPSEVAAVPGGRRLGSLDRGHSLPQS